MRLNRTAPTHPFIHFSLCVAILLAGTVPGTAQEKIRGLEKIDSFPLLHNEFSNEEYVPDTTRIYFTPENIVYQLYYNHGTMVRSADGKDVHKSEKRSFWLVQERDSSYGYAFDENRPAAQKWMHVDSALTGHGMLRFQIDLSEKGPLRRLQFVKDTATGILHETYVMHDGTKQQKDTMYFSHSTRMNAIPFTLNKGIDKYTGMKLFYIKLVTGEHPVTGSKIPIPNSAIISRFYEIPVNNADEIMKYIGRFRLIGKRKAS